MFFKMIKNKNRVLIYFGRDFLIFEV